jgi:Cu(I)/Ag(I) efflux system periplasmic protein CusF
MRNHFVAAALVLAAASAFAQTHQAVAPGKAAEPAGSAASAGFSEGDVRKIDRPAGKITLKHGEIRNLDMPPMTMVFGVTDAAMLDRVKAGDKVRFKAASLGGKLTLTELQAAD